ncbi:MAG: RibD family protein [Alphaproteobacteria bacterium]|nr:RibD family protein [Alphaproteobacteria bacterium]MCW5742521.1 RibD family protein [Alphaproteobacteria bacterium]
MKPHVICHMVSSIDGRTRRSRWRPEGSDGELFERLHDRIGCDAWLVGRVTGHEFSRRKGEAYPAHDGPPIPREPFIARRGAAAYGVVLDAHGKLCWGRPDIGGDPIVVVLGEQVGDAHLAGLRAEGHSYIFAGRQTLDLALALEILNRELGIRRLLVEGGGTANGAFLRAGLIDEISIAIQPVVDGGKGVSASFDALADAPFTPAPLTAMTLKSCEVLDGGAVWLRYELTNAR